MSKVYANYSLGAGLTFQQGPFKYKKNEQAPVQRVPWKGGGVASGGQGHAGHGNYQQWMNPASFPMEMVQPPLPTPSRFASIVSTQDIFEPSTHKGPPGTFQPSQTTGQPPPPSGAQKPGQSIFYFKSIEEQETDTQEPIGNTPVKTEQPTIKQEAAGPSVVHSGNQTYDYDEAPPDNITRHQSTEGFGQQTDPASVRDFNQQTMVVDEAKWADRLESLIYSLSDVNANLRADLASMTAESQTNVAIQLRQQQVMKKILQHFGVENIPEYISIVDFEQALITFGAEGKYAHMLIGERQALETFGRHLREYTAKEEEEYKEYLNLKAEREGFVEGSRKRRKSIYEQTLETARLQNRERTQTPFILTPFVPTSVGNIPRAPPPPSRTPVGRISATAPLPTSSIYPSVVNPVPATAPHRSIYPHVDHAGGVPTTAAEMRQGWLTRLDMERNKQMFPRGKPKSGYYKGGKPKKSEMKEEYPFPTRKSKRK